MVDKRLIDALLGNGPSSSSYKVPVEPRSQLGSVFGSSLTPDFGLSLGPSNGLFAPFAPAPTPDGIIASTPWSSFPEVKPLTAANTPRREPAKRMVYFAFDFDDVMRVNNVRQTGKIGGRVMGASRGFRDRSVWKASKAFTDPGLKRMMQGMSKFSSVVCVLIGSNTWVSRWVRYEIALSVINERGLLAVDLNGINHNIRQAPDPLGVNPLSMMGLRNDLDGSWHLVERKPVELDNGDVVFEWHWYMDYRPPVPKPKFVPDIAAGEIIPFSAFTKRYDFSGNSGSMNISSWLDAAAIEAGR